VTDINAPLDADRLPARLAEVFDVVGPLYRLAQRKVEQDAPVHGLSVGVRAVLNLLLEHGPMTVPQMGRAQALSRQFGEGTAAITALIGHERELMRQVGGGLTDADITACLRVLTRMLEFLGDVDVN
jgi:hypothetical protein